MINLSNVSRGSRVGPPLMMVYGPEGAGKTSFACGAPAPLLLRAERGNGNLDVARYPLDVADGGTDTFTCYEELLDALCSVYTRPVDEFRTVILDSATSVEKLVHAKVERDAGVPLEKIDGGYGKWPRYAETKWWELLEALSKLNQQGRIVILLAHAEVKPYMAPDGESYDQFVPRCHTKAREILVSQVEHLLFLQNAVALGREALGWSKSRKYAASVRRVLYTSRRPAFAAKNRLGLPAHIDIPDCPDNPTAGWDAFAAALAAPAKARAEAEAARAAEDAQETSNQ